MSSFMRAFALQNAIPYSSSYFVLNVHHYLSHGKVYPATPSAHSGQTQIILEGSIPTMNFYA